MATKGQRDRRGQGRGRAVSDVKKLDADPGTIEMLTAVLASFEAYRATGVIHEIPGMSEADWVRAERLLDGVS